MAQFDKCWGSNWIVHVGLEGLLSGNMMDFVEVLLIESLLEHLVVLPLC
jgi:hypothetical protein